jgi:diguanylate cyclase (GGDEF)-like protein
MKSRVVRLGRTISFYLLVPIIGYLDFITGPEIGFSLFYLMPVFLASWFNYEEKVSVYAIPVLAALAWVVADLGAGPRYSMSWIPYWNMFIRLTIFVLMAGILSRLRVSIHHEEELARIDPLTGVFNSRHFAELALKEISRSARFGEPLTFVFIDVDNFKTVNDTRGHDQGDELLRTMAQLISRRVRDIDILARLGGDEFGILLPKTDQKKSHAVMEKIYSIFDESVAARWPVSLSAGVATFTYPPENLDAMIKAADTLMYDAKRSGKNKARYAVIRNQPRSRKPRP